VADDAVGAVSELTKGHRYGPKAPHGITLRPRGTRVKDFFLAVVGAAV